MNSTPNPSVPADLDPALLRLLQRAACIAELSPGVTHKLNNSLAGTLSNLELIALEENLPTTVVEWRTSSQLAAWQAAELNRAFVDFITRGPSAVGPVDVDGILAQVVHLLGRFSDRRVAVAHTPAPQRVGARTHAAVLTDAVVALTLLGQRLLTSGGAIKLSVAAEATQVVVNVALHSTVPNPGPASPQSLQLLEWVTRSLAVTAGGSLDTEEQNGRISAFRLRLPPVE